ncbi:MAG: carboxypeptidase regulatory-like domain-containing protein [Verrucomicrobiales bacterium]|nr:carboxypeptidase regulatory-like domain-containing protein [Verrucomicrobiales bacterium]
MTFAPGCEYLAPPHQEWTEARIVGTVVDGETHSPIPGAKITRVRPNAPNTGGFGDRDKGGPQMVDQPAVATSGSSGRFELEAVKTAYLLLDSFPDYAVTIRVQAEGYQTLQRYFTNVTYANGDKKTVPIIEAGDIALRRK